MARGNLASSTIGRGVLDVQKFGLQPNCLSAGTCIVAPALFVPAMWHGSENLTCRWCAESPIDIRFKDSGERADGRRQDIVACGVPIPILSSVCKLGIYSERSNLFSTLGIVCEIGYTPPENAKRNQPSLRPPLLREEAMLQSIQNLRHRLGNALLNANKGINNSN